MAGEIKQLTDGPKFYRYRIDQHSLYNRLATDRDRSYHLSPVLAGQTLPGSWVPRVKRAIAEQAPRLQVGDEIALRIPRHSRLKYCGECKPGTVTCKHGTGRDLCKILPDITGFFQLLDDCEPGHQFLTDETRTTFMRRLERACIASKKRGSAEFHWNEEWWLCRLRDPPKGEGGVHVAAIAVDFPESAAIQSFAEAIGRAKRKFESRRWADHTAAVLHAGEQQSELPISAFNAAIAALEPRDISPLDAVFLLDGHNVSQYFGSVDRR